LYEFICGCERSERKDDDSLMRTPSVVDSTGGAISEKQARERGRMVKVADQAAQLAFENGLQVSESVAESLLPTPTLGHLRNHDEPVEDYLQRRQDFVEGRTKGMPGASLGVAVRTTNWGKFEPAIRKWETLTRPAPDPTLPDGKDGAHRLSSKFTEWMMGLPDGWITGHGLKRNDELKMAGNGVVPQQAVLALRYLLGETIDIPKA
jgi:DNA (cytosine-5)-methyltransferase 1